MAMDLGMLISKETSFITFFGHSWPLRQCSMSFTIYHSFVQLFVARHEAYKHRDAF